jgi:FixJ family two-component response regulator
MNAKPDRLPPSVYVHSEKPEIAQFVERASDYLGLGLKTSPSLLEIARSVNPRLPGVVVVAFEQDIDGLREFFHHLNTHEIVVPVIVLAGNATLESILAIMDLGAFKIMHRNQDRDALRRNIQEAISKDLRRCTMREIYDEVDQALKNLTPRQLVVLQNIVDGKPTKAIAVSLRLSQRMIEKERSSILEAFHVQSTSEVTLRVGEYRVLRQMFARQDDAHAMALPHFQHPASIDVVNP